MSFMYWPARFQYWRIFMSTKIYLHTHTYLFITYIYIYKVQLKLAWVPYLGINMHDQRFYKNPSGIFLLRKVGMHNYTVLRTSLSALNDKSTIY